MNSLWSREVKLERRETFAGNSKADVVVIGAGMAGLLIAYKLKKSGIDVIVLDADRIGSGQTKNTTAKITSQHGIFYSKLIKNIGEEKAKLYALANQKAIDEFQKIIDIENIDCDFERLPAYLYSSKENTNSEEKNNDIKYEGRDNLEKEVEASNKLGIPARFKEGKESELPLKVQGMVEFERQAQFNPLKFMEKLAEVPVIYEKSRVLSVDDHMVYTEMGDIWADSIVFATHYPIINVPGFYFLRQHQERSYVLALENAQKLKGMYYGVEEDVLSFRNAGNILLLGGSGHRTGENNIFREKQLRQNGQCCGAYDYLRSRADELYPKHKEIAHWSAQDCITHDGIPFIGRYSSFKPFWYVATGFNKWGMTSSMVSSMIISDEIMGNESPFRQVFTPWRFNCKASYKNLFTDMKVSIKGLTAGYLKKDTKQCSHMGCELKWNEDEKSFDCSCHGSRFDKDGRVIDEPAQTNIELKD